MRKARFTVHKVITVLMCNREKRLPQCGNSPHSLNMFKKSAISKLQKSVTL